MTEKKVYKPNCCTGCTFADECFSDTRIKCADYEIAMKEYYRGLSEGLEEGCVKARKLEKEKAELEETIGAQDDKIDFYVSKMNEHIRKNKNLEEDNLNKQDLINDYVFENAKLTKENERLSKMLEIVLPKALAHENHIFYEHKRTLEQYRADLEKRVENKK